MCDINSMSRSDASNRRNSVPCTVRTSRHRSCSKGLVVCNDWDIKRLDLLNGLALGIVINRPLKY